MKAWAYDPTISRADLRPVERPDPVPGAGQILVRMAAAGLNYRDLAIARGAYHVGVAAPLIPLSDGAGVVQAVGSGVTRFRVGDIACPVYMPDWIDGEVTAAVARRRLGGPSDGVLRELMCLSQDDAVQAPSHLSPIEAAALPVAAVTAWHSLNVVGRLRAGDTVLVQGSGGVSMFAIQFARIAGVRVISVLRSDRHAQAVIAAGAHDVIVADVADWPGQVMTLTRRRGADVVIDVGGAATLKASIASSAIGGQVHLIGYASGTNAEIDIFEAIRHAVTIAMGRGGHRTSFEAMVRAMEVQGTRPVIDTVFAAGEVHQALDRLDGGGLAGKVILTI